MDFDRVIDRFGSHSVKWDMMEALYNVPPRDGIAMWVKPTWISNRRSVFRMPWREWL